MPTPDEEKDVDSQVAVLANSMARMTEELKEVTHELRRTNDSVKDQQAEARLARQQLDNISREVWDRNNSSRIHSLELQVKGVYAFLSFLAITLAGRLAPTFFHFIMTGR